MTVQFRGSADRLEKAMNSMLANFVVAVLILFLLMAALFKSARDSLLVLLTMPMALAGGVHWSEAVELVCIPISRPADDDWFYHSAGSGCQQCDFVS